MNHYRLVMFDFDGTLCCSRAAMVHCLRQTFLQQHMSPPHEKVLLAAMELGGGLEETLIFVEPQLSEISPEHMQQWFQIYRAIYLEEALAKTRCYPGAKALLQQLAEAGVAIAVVSNKSEKAVNAALEHFQMQPYVQHVVGAQPGRLIKPSITVFHDYVKPYFPSIGLHEILMVGDTHTDLIFAKKLGIDACWVTYGYGRAADCHQLHPTLIVKQLGDLAERLATSDTALME